MDRSGDDEARCGIRTIGQSPHDDRLRGWQPPAYARRMLRDLIARLLARSELPLAGEAPVPTGPPAPWVAVANVVEDTSFLPAQAEKGGRGTRHFSPRTKVYVRDIFFGPGGEFSEVVGRHRGSKQYVKLVMRSDFLENARVKLVHSPRVLELLALEGRTWSEAEAKSYAERCASFLNQISRPYRP